MVNKKRPLRPKYKKKTYVKKCSNKLEFRTRPRPFRSNSNKFYTEYHNSFTAKQVYKYLMQKSLLPNDLMFRKLQS